MNEPPDKTNRILKKVCIHDSPDKCALLIQPAVRSSFKPWGSYSTKRQARTCAPHTLRQASENTRRKWIYNLITRQAKGHFVFRKKIATRPAQAEEKYPTFENAVVTAGEHHVKSCSAWHRQSRIRLWGSPAWLQHQQDKMASVATRMACRQNTRLCR